MEQLTDEILVKELRILWQNTTQEDRDLFASVIKNYFCEGARAEKIINALQASY